MGTALQKLIQALPKGTFVFQGPGSAELWDLSGFDVNVNQVLNLIDHDETPGLILWTETAMRAMALVPGDYHFNENDFNAKRLTEIVSASIALSTVFYALLDACRGWQLSLGCYG